MSTQTKECIGECPYCGSDNVDYHQSETDENYITYPATCLDCKKPFEELYAITYSFTEFKETENAN